jgi:hypothetical protein
MKMDRYTAQRDDGAPIQEFVSVPLPPGLPHGRSKINVSVRDSLQNAFLQTIVPFNVDDPSIRPAAALQIRDVVFDQGNLAFRVFGIKLRRGRLRLRIGLRVQGRETDTDRPDWLRIDDSFDGYGPRSFLPIAGFIGPLKPGSYSARITVRDDFAETEVSNETTFEGTAASVSGHAPAAPAVSRPRD